jgi:hypothetical protein
MPTFADAQSISGRALLRQGKVDAALALFAARDRTSPGSFGDLEDGFGMSYDIAGIHALLDEFGPRVKH